MYRKLLTLVVVIVVGSQVAQAQNNLPRGARIISTKIVTKSAECKTCEKSEASANAESSNALPVKAISLNTSSAESFCKCEGDAGGDCDGCKEGENTPKIKNLDNGQCEGGKECHDITPDIDKNVPDDCEEHKFYDHEKTFNGISVPGPVLKKVKTQTIEFKTLKYTVKCCEITVCVPCKECCEVTEDCEMQDVKATVIAKRRTGTNNYDVYALNVPGMPKEYMLYLNTPEAEVENGLPGVLLP